jgi:hypothetical protein
MACAGALERLLGIVYDPFATAFAGEDAGFTLIDVKDCTNCSTTTVPGHSIDTFLFLHAE